MMTKVYIYITENDLSCCLSNTKITAKINASIWIAASKNFNVEQTYKQNIKLTYKKKLFPNRFFKLQASCHQRFDKCKSS